MIARSLVAALFIVGCGTSSGVGSDCAQDGTCPSGLRCFPDFRCYPPNADPSCQPACYGVEPFCDQATLRCVACRTDGDCPGGTLCVAPVMRCEAGCSATHPSCAGDTETCDVDAGVCLACQSDADCTDPKSPRCCGNRCVDPQSDGDNCGACGNACSGGATCCSGACSHLTADVENCGACGVSCVLPNVASPACDQAACKNSGCESFFGDCDGNPQNGCETNLSYTATDCGQCGVHCTAFKNAQPACVLAACALGPCLSGFANCDGISSNGCEYATSGFATDAMNCGGCGNRCATGKSCVSGQCL